MTEHALRERVSEWDSYPDTDGNTTAFYETIWRRLEWFGEKEWNKYHPTMNPPHLPSYMARLAQWVGNVSHEDDQKLLLEYAAYITFFSQEDFVALYQSAFWGPISQWVARQSQVRLSDSAFNETLNRELLNNTWYCPITDSLNIAEFCHVNGIQGVSSRPQFIQYFRQATDPISPIDPVPGIHSYITEKGIKRIVLLEDFVGSGSQVGETLVWALKSLNVPILFVPLIICPAGLKMAHEIQKLYPLFSANSVIRLTEHDLLGDARGGKHFGRPDLADAIERVARTTFSVIAGAAQFIPNAAPYHPFGYEETGCSVVNYSNTPDNTLPLIHHKPASSQWNPLFVRSTRVL